MEIEVGAQVRLLEEPMTKHDPNGIWRDFIGPKATVTEVLRTDDDYAYMVHIQFEGMIPYYWNDDPTKIAGHIDNVWVSPEEIEYV